MNFSGLSDEEWKLIENHFTDPPKRGRGKPHTPWRNVVNTILWVLKSDGKWCLAPRGENWASKSAAHRWFKRWQETGLWNTISEVALQPKNI